MKIYEVSIYKTPRVLRICFFNQIGEWPQGGFRLGFFMGHLEAMVDLCWAIGGPQKKCLFGFEVASEKGTSVMTLMLGYSEAILGSLKAISCQIIQALARRPRFWSCFGYKKWLFETLAVRWLLFRVLELLVLGHLGCVWGGHLFPNLENQTLNQNWIRKIHQNPSTKLKIHILCPWANILCIFFNSRGCFEAAQISIPYSIPGSLYVDIKYMYILHPIAVWCQMWTMKLSMTRGGEGLVHTLFGDLLHEPRWKKQLHSSWTLTSPSHLRLIFNWKISFCSLVFS